MDRPVSPAAGVVDGCGGRAAFLTLAAIPLKNLRTRFFRHLSQTAGKTTAEQSPKHLALGNLSLLLEKSALGKTVPHLPDEGGLLPAAVGAIGTTARFDRDPAVGACGRIFSHPI